MAGYLGRLSLVVGCLAFAVGNVAAEPAVSVLRVQKVGQVTYFQVRFESPADLQAPRPGARLSWINNLRTDLLRLPRLVPQDKKTAHVNLRFLGDDNAPDTLRYDHLEFLGRVDQPGEVRLLLLYPKQTAKDKEGDEVIPLDEVLRRRSAWVEVPITLDLTKAKNVPVPKEGFARDKGAIDNDDLEGLWASGQRNAFDILRVLAPDFGFYGFARETTAKKYHIPATTGLTPPAPAAEFLNLRAYEITTGAAAITESMALERFRNPKKADAEARTVAVSGIAGIDIAEHAWLKMMAGKKPAPELLAHLVPHDNYYIHFKNIGKLIELMELLDQWGTTLSRAIEVNSRDAQLKERILEQLCLESNQLARVFGPAVIKSIAFTGSDPYVREGADLAILFHVTNARLFLTAVDPYIENARKKFGNKLKADKSTHEKVAIESFVTPFREVSLHRATIGDVVVYANSLVGLQRIIEAKTGKFKALADSLDFQYMRTVFRLDDPAEDGFVFISDPFLRDLLGPATRIKERRRLEALTSLSMVNNGALYTAWATGKLPAHHEQLLAVTGLTRDQLFSPEGAAAYWDHDAELAVSPFYNTLQFATPLIEIPIDKVTATEEREYNQFRQEYLRLWGRVFDPIGMRFSLRDGEVRWETYILPLIKNNEYERMRRLFGDGTVSLDPGMFSDKTIWQFFAHISPKAEERKQLGRILTSFSRDIPGLNFVGDWVTLRLDDSPVYGKLLERAVRQSLEVDTGVGWDDELRLLFQIPVTAGVEIRNPLVLAAVLAAAKKMVTEALPGAIDWEQMKDTHKGIPIVEIKARPGALGLAGLGKAQPTLYYALVEGAWYISLRLEPIKEIIEAARTKDLEKKAKKVDVNTSVYISPQAAVDTKKFGRFYLEWETHRRAQANLVLLYPLYHAGVITGADDAAHVQNMALKFFGFIPVSPDYSPYSFDAKKDEVTNKRHGSLRQPKLEKDLAPGSALDRLLDQLRTIRADLRFREDGIHTTVTIRKK